MFQELFQWLDLEKCEGAVKRYLFSCYIKDLKSLKAGSNSISQFNLCGSRKQLCRHDSQGVVALTKSTS